MENLLVATTKLADSDTVKLNDDRWVTFKANGIKCELKTRRNGTEVRIGYLNCLSDRLAIRNGIVDILKLDAQLLGRDGGVVFIKTKLQVEAFEILTKVVQYIKDNDIRRTASAKPFNGADRIDAINHILQYRAMGVTFRPDLGFESVHFTCGQSENVTKKNVYREHAVPVWTLLQLIEGKTNDEAFDILDRNLHIVLITKEDAKHLDHDLKLQTVMPEGWVDGDTPFARFNTGKIPLILIK